MVNDGLLVEGLDVSIEGTKIIDDVCLQVPAGEILVLLGPSGCGKSTLLRAIAGLQPVDSGSVAWSGTELGDTPTHQRGFGLMFQQDALFPHRSVEANVGFGLEMQHLSAAARRVRTSELLALIGLPGFGARPVDGLSGGEAQRVALARALAPQPRLLLLDEPLASLDRLMRERLVEDLLRLRDDLLLTAIHVTHDRDEAFALADQIGVMRDGHVVATGTPDSLWADPKTEWVARFLGHRNIVPVIVEGGRMRTPFGEIGQVSSPDEPPTAAVLPDGSVRIVSKGQVAGTVRTTRFTAWGFESTVLSGEIELIATSGDRPAIGSTIGLDIDLSRRCLLYPDQPR